jgi:hypothetical protein
MKLTDTNQAAVPYSSVLTSRLGRSWIHQSILFVLCLIILLRTMVPTLYTLDSAELATGVATLGIVHAPGYPLYLVIAHLFTLLPIGDVAFRVNLFSALCLSLTAPAVYGLMVELLADRTVALVSALIFVLSYYVWATGIVAEIYAPQIVTLALCGWYMVAMYRRHLTDWRSVIVGGILVGIAVATAPSSIMFVPGVMIMFVALRIPWNKCLVAGAVSILVFCVPLLYFPIRYAASPALNMAGQYLADGTFKAVNLQSLDGIWWMVRGAQFNDLFFADGYRPSLEQFARTVRELWSNYLGFGLILGLIGLGALFAANRRFLLIWLVFFLPYIYFYAAYGAPDRDTMFGPTYLLWAIVLAYGLKWATQSVPVGKKMLALLVLPVAMLVINFGYLDASRDTSVRDYSQTLLDSLPPNSTVVGVWWDIAPLQYLQMVEGKRPDVTLLNDFLFDRETISQYVDFYLSRPQASDLVFLGNAILDLDLNQYLLTPLEVNDTLPPRSGGSQNPQAIQGGFYVMRQPK